jgi:Fur family iron response transcriptional regulator
MQREPVERTLTRHGIQPSAQRRAIAEFVLCATDHPSADRVFEAARSRAPGISRATVYNTLNLFVQKGLLRELVLAEGAVVFDPNVAPHHHFIDEDTGEIHDVPWGALDVRRVAPLSGMEVREVQVVLRGRRRSRYASSPVVHARHRSQRSGMADDDKKNANEGEGSRSADRRYREGVKETVRRGHVEEDAERARRDVDARPDEYRDAEREGRSRSAGEAPGDLEKRNKR